MLNLLLAITIGLFALAAAAIALWFIFRNGDR